MKSKCIAQTILETYAIFQFFTKFWEVHDWQILIRTCMLKSISTEKYLDQVKYTFSDRSSITVIEGENTVYFTDQNQLVNGIPLRKIVVAVQPISKKCYNAEQ